MKRYVLPIFLLLAILPVLLMNSIRSDAAPLAQKSTPVSPEEDVIAIEEAILDAISDQRGVVLAYLVNDVKITETHISEDEKWAASYTVMFGGMA